MIPRLMIVDDEAPARSRLRTLLADIESTCPHLLIGEAASAAEALAALPELRPDVLLLDVQMPGMSGLELAARLAQEPDAPAIVFVTAYDEHALKAFEVHALDYLLKPVRAQRLAEAIARAATLRERAQAAARLPARRHFSVHERGRVMLVPVAEVLYCRAELKYVTLRTREHEYVIEESLASIEEELGEHFVRVHRNALVARAAIVGFERANVAAEEGERAQDTWQVVLRDLDERLPISRRQWSVLRTLLSAPG